MNAPLSKRTVVDLMTAELAASRRTATARRAAYVALAHAILADESDRHRAVSIGGRQPAPLVQSLVAA